MRVQVFKDASKKQGKVFGIPKHIKELFYAVCKTFGVSVNSLYTEQGAEIDDVSLIRDDELLFIFPTLPSAERGSDVGTQTTERKTDVRQHNDWLALNVGGKKFCTTRSTLVGSEPESMLAKMFQDKCQWNNTQDESGAFLIDRSPVYFEIILDYLRHGILILGPNINPEGVLEEARFFRLEGLIGRLENMVAENQPKVDHSPLTRREVSLALLTTQANCELRFQGMNFEGADLSQLDLRYINFKLANLRGCKLTRANLYCCSLERADLSNSMMDGANLQGVKMLCCNAEGSSMKGCNFDDPSGLKTNMEGANMKGVNFEGSLMAGANLRVATLKNSNLKNCNLRGAILAGTDLEVRYHIDNEITNNVVVGTRLQYISVAGNHLEKMNEPNENCDLSGCDLYEANLRGCNVTGTKFEEMITPLHMTQTVP